MGLGNTIPKVKVLRGFNTFLVYMMPLFFGIGIYLTPIFYFFELYNRDIYLEKIGI